MTNLVVAWTRRRAAPRADQEVERHQHQVEEEDEQREVLGAEGAEDGRLGEHQVEEEEARAVPFAQRGGERRCQPEDRREGDQEQAQAVDAEVVANPELADPGSLVT